MTILPTAAQIDNAVSALVADGANDSLAEVIAGSAQFKSFFLELTKSLEERSSEMTPAEITSVLALGMVRLGIMTGLVMARDAAEAKPPGKGATKPPGKGATKPPGKGATKPPGKGAGKP